MHGLLVTAGNHTVDPDAETLRRALDSDAQFWWDISDLSTAAADLLRGDFGFHPLAVEDAEHFGQRPKIEQYQGFALVVAFGADGDGRPVEVHAFLTDRFLVTVHRGRIESWEPVTAQATTDGDGDFLAPVMLLHHLWDSLVDSVFPVLTGLDEAIDALQDDILAQPTDAQLGVMFRLKRRVITLRRIASEQRDMAAPLVSGTRALPGMTDESQRYFRDLYDHLTRISQTADSYRDLLSSALDTHLSMTSNRLNVVMKQLSIIATVFLPLTFLTGFFGQNFGWLVDRAGGAAVFWIVGVGLPVVVAGGLLLMFRRMGWLSGRAR